MLETNVLLFKYTGITQAVKEECVPNIGDRKGVVSLLHVKERGVKKDFIKKVHI